MAAGTPLSAKNAKVRISTTTVLYAASWDVQPEATLSPVNNFEGGGFEDDIACLKKCTFTVEGWWDGGANMHDAPLSIKAGAVLTNVRLYVYDTTGPYWSFPSVNVQSVPVTARVEDKIMYRLSCKAKGQYVEPTGNAV